MKIMNLRYGDETKYNACGPIDLGSGVELMLLMDDGCIKFVYVSQMESFAKACVSNVPVFDIMANIFNDDVDMDAELAVIEKASEEQYGYEIHHLPEELATSEYFPAVKLAHWILQDNCGLESLTDAIAKYKGVEVRNVDVPDFDVEED